MSDRFVIGCDFGTLSMRSALVRLRDGAIVAEEVYTYPAGVITDSLNGVKLEGQGWALQDPDDYIAALCHCVPAVLRSSGTAANDVIAIGVDFTTCTVMPMAEDGRAMCQLPEYRDRPHAWVKLWKNHTALKEADEITEFVRKNGLDVLDYYGLRASSEWLFPKIWEILRKDPEIYEKSYTFLEGGDFVVYKLCGRIVRSGVFAAAKGLHDNKRMHFPSRDFFRGLDERLENVVEDKHLTNVVQVGTQAGRLTAEMAYKLGLHENVVICTAHGDAACTLPGVGIVEPNVMTLVMGTSLCHMMLSRHLEKIPGMSAAYFEGVIPGYYCYEAGQSAVGDIFDWFCSRFLPEAYTAEAKSRGIHIMRLMNEKAGALKVGESGVLALDWMNGNRSILQDSNLTGLLIGLTLTTKPEEVYRALLESTAFGTKIILDQFCAYHVPIDSLYACGGLAQKNEVLMQIFADVIDMPIKVSAVRQASAMGTAIMAAVCAGPELGGYVDYAQAVSAMVPPPSREYLPVEKNVEQYKKLFAIYRDLHDSMAQEGSPVKRLLDIQRG